MGGRIGIPLELPSGRQARGGDLYEDQGSRLGDREEKVIGAENFRLSVREFTSLQRVLANVDIMERENILYAQLAHGMEP